MANWCSNSVAFEGNEIALEQVKLEFRKMQIRENEENCGQLPEFISDKNRGYFFDILLEDGGCVFNYQTRWSPNAEILLQIAEHYKVDFIYNYEEIGVYYQTYCDRTTAIRYAKRLSKTFYSEVRLTEGKEPLKTSGTYINEQTEPLKIRNYGKLV